MVDRALETFVEQLDSLSLLDIGVHLVGLYPLMLVLIVVHEFGHALVGLACTDGLVTVRVGRTPGALRGRVGRLAFSFDHRPGRHAEDGLTELLADRDTARAGWCWREVRPADAASLEGAPRKAWVTHSLEGLAGPELAGAAAVELAGGGNRYLNGERRAGMEAAFHATNELRNTEDESERSWFAFRYGVALHDVERVMEQHGQRYW